MIDAPIKPELDMLLRLSWPLKHIFMTQATQSPRIVADATEGDIAVEKVVYGTAAIRATEVLTQDMTDSQSSQTTSCPKGAYLGLCSEGMVKGVRPGKYTHSIKNKKYAVDAVLALRLSQRNRGNPSLAGDPRGLWNTIMGGVEKQENGQMDVVIALWKDGLLE
jgi:hypothetical protein